MIGAYLHTLDVSKMEPVGQLVDIERCITCRSRAICCQHMQPHRFVIIGDAMVGGQGRETRGVKVRLSCTANWPRPRASTRTALMSRVHTHLAIVVMRARRAYRWGDPMVRENKS